MQGIDETIVGGRTQFSMTKPDNYIYPHDSGFEELGEAVAKLQSHIHKLENPLRSYKLRAAAKIFEMWLNHPRGRNWNLISDLNNLT